MIDMFRAQKSLSCSKPGADLPSVDDFCIANPELDRKYNRPKTDLATLGGVDVIGLSVGLKDDKVIRIMSKLPASGHDRLYDALASKYGPPDDSKTSTLQNRMGASFAQSISIWKRGAAAMTLTSPSGMIDEMTLVLEDTSRLKELTDSYKERAKSDSKDL